MSPDVIQTSGTQYHIQGIFAKNISSESNQASTPNFQFTRNTGDEARF